MLDVNLKEFYIICMKTRNNKVLYLKSSIGNSAEWTFNREESIWFETLSDADTFAHKYFKNFKEWYITGI